MTHTHEGRLPLLSQSNFLGKAATSSKEVYAIKAMWHAGEWPQVRDTCVCVCVCTGKAILESQTQLSGGKPHLWAWLLTGWTAGEVVLWEGGQGSWHSQLKPGALFSINIMCQETPQCKLPPIVARGWIWREGALLQTGVRLLPQDSPLLNPEVPGKHQSWRQKKKKMCTVTSKVKEKIPFSKTT